MGVILALVMGCFMGWLASKLMSRDAQMGVLLNVIVGCVGSILGRLLFGSFLGGGSLRTGVIDLMTPLTSVIGAVALLVIVNLIQRGTVR